MRVNIGLWVAVVAVAWSAASHRSQAAVLLTGTSYSEDFDNGELGAAVTGHWSSVAGTQNAVPGTSGWDGVKLAGTGTTNMSFLVSDGSSNTGAIYNYGAVGSAERALGSIASGTNIPGIGVEIVNGTGAPLTSVTISYTGEYWRSSTVEQNVLAFGYAIGPSGSASYLSAGGATAVAALDLVGPAPVGANGALDGNLPANQIARSATIDNINVPAGQSLYLRWQDANNGGNDAGLAVDDFEIVNNVPEPSSIALLGLVGVGVARLVRRSRRG